jgi:NAD-dependent deacetylase
VSAARRIVVLTGAGLSTDSGIPDFRGPDGVWTKNPAAEKASTLQHWLRDGELRKRSWQSRLDAPLFAARPNDGHRALVHLEREGRLAAVVTQNVDGLHQAAVLATNVYHKTPEGWRMVAHHASPGTAPDVQVVDAQRPVLH